MSIGHWETQKSRNSVLKGSYCLQDKIQTPQNSLQHPSLPFLHSPWLTMLQPQASSFYSWNTPSLFLPQDLCTCCFLSLNLSFPGFLVADILTSGLSSNVTSFVRPWSTQLPLSPHPHPHPYPRNSLLYLLHSSKYQLLKLAVFLPLFIFVYYYVISWEQGRVSLDLEHFACTWFLLRRCTKGLV